jgi:hypothetical protein
VREIAMGALQYSKFGVGCIKIYVQCCTAHADFPCDRLDFHSVIGFRRRVPLSR